MIDRHSSLPVTRRCKLLSLNRSTACYQPKDVSDDDLKIMLRIDEMHLKRPFYGSRRIRDWLVAENYDINTQTCSAVNETDGYHGALPKERHPSS